MKKILFYNMLVVGSFLCVTNAQAFVDIHDTILSPPKTFTLTIGDQKIIKKGPELATWFREIPTLDYDNTKNAEIENTTICPQDFAPCPLRMSQRQRAHIVKQSAYLPDEFAIKEYVTTLAQKIGTPPIDAKLGVVNGKITVLTPHKNGIGIDIDTTTDHIINALKNNRAAIAIPYTQQQATVRSDNLAQLGLRELIGEGESDFSGSTTSRIFNIKVAAKKFDGLLIAPGEEFSFVEHLGPVDGEHGFKKELVIKDNQTKPEYGGGICQVSTTVFRSAILTGLKITQRRNHSYPVHYYYPTGFDATVYVPSPDMRFKNNTAHYIMLAMHMDEKTKKLSFQIYGTDDGRAVDMRGPVVTERHPDGSMKTFFTQTVKDHNGNVIIDDTFYSNYRSPKDYPRPGQEQQKFTTKPKNWSKKQWREYKAANHL